MTQGVSAAAQLAFWLSVFLRIAADTGACTQAAAHADRQFVEPSAGATTHCRAASGEGPESKNAVWDQANPLQYRAPYMAQLGHVGDAGHACLAVLIHPEYALTAAHCVEAADFENVHNTTRVQFGGHTVDNHHVSEEIFEVKSIIAHPMWKKDGQPSGYDIALLKLRRPSNRPVPIILRGHVCLRTGQKLFALGWQSNAGQPICGKAEAPALIVEEQEFLEASDCNRSSAWNGTVKDGLICGFSRDWDTCSVPSGTPLMLLDMPRYEVGQGDPALDFIVGLYVHGAPCDESRKPDIYIDLRVHESWIAQRMMQKRGTLLRMRHER